MSIIITLSSPVDLTYACLESLLAYTTLPYELILIKTPHEDQLFNLLFQKIKNIKIIDHPADRGYAPACNQGADMARGEFLVFLSSGTRVTPAWDALLVKGLNENRAWGAVGVKQVDPHGKLLEAGDILWQDGTCSRYGAGDNPYKPEYSFVRQVDFCSPSCFLIRRNLFQVLGGFDASFVSSSYGAADLALRLRQQGGLMMYCPSVTVYHPASSSGTAPPLKNSDSPEADRGKLLERWGTHLGRQGAPTTDPLWLARDRRSGARILFIEDRIPAPPQGCGFPRSFTIVRYLAEMGYVVTVLPTQSPVPWQPFTRILEDLGVETLYGRPGDWRRWFRERENGYEVVWVSRHHNLPEFIQLIRTFLPGAGLIFDSEALFSLRELEKIKRTVTRHRSIREIQFQKRLREEIQLIKQVDLVVTVSEKEGKLLGEAGVKNIHIWSHAVPRQPSAVPFNDRKDLLFVGGFTARESPNTAAVLYFAEKVFPALSQKLGVRLWIVGSNPPEAVRRLSSDQIKVTGFVENLEPCYHRSRVFVVPHQYAGGIPLKLLEAMGRGLPAVVSDMVAGQLGLSQEREVLIAASAEDFIRATERLYTDENLWRGLQERGLAFIEAACGPDALKVRLREIIAAAGGLKRPAPSSRTA